MEGLSQGAEAGQVIQCGFDPVIQIFHELLDGGRWSISLAPHSRLYVFVLEHLRFWFPASLAANEDRPDLHPARASPLLQVWHVLISAGGARH